MAFDPPSWPGGFNGGTITAPLVVSDPATGDTAIRVNLPAGFSGDILGVYDSLSNLVAELYDLGLYLSDPVTGEFALLTPGGSTFLATTAAGFGAIDVRNSGSGLALRVKTAAGTEAGGFSNGGYFVTSLHTAPADAALAAGEAMLWFDQTDGVDNTKLMVKAKSADGTVKTASIVLA